MLPPIIKRKLSALRWWECSLRLSWGAARWLVLVLALLALACLTDWLIDRFFQTPWAFRVLMFLGQVAIGLAAAALLLVRPLTRRLSDNDMTLMVEDRHPELHHRLISVVQFHRPGARLEGMSRELIDRVTAETEEQTAHLHFAGVADARRLAWAAACALPALLVAAGLCLAFPETAWALLSRQLLADVAIPRSIYLENLNKEIWPKGEEVVLRFRVTGSGAANLNSESTGLLRIDPEDMPSEYVPLKIEANPDTGNTFAVASLPVGYVNAHYRAWLRDGRLEEPGYLQYEPRPEIQEIHALVVLPRSCGLRPKSKLPYEIEQARGEVTAIDGSSARVWIKVQKPVRKATLQLLGPAPPLQNPFVIAAVVGWSASPPGSVGLLPRLAGAAPSANGSSSLAGFETVVDEIKPKLHGVGSEVDFPVFALRPGTSGYRLIVEDEYGFKNIPAPRRGIRIVPEEPPQVALLPEQFPPDNPLADLGGTVEDYYADGAPVPSGSRFLIAYTCSGAFGLGTARLHFRVVKNTARTSEDGSSATETESTNWISVSLKEKLASVKTGAFDLRRGAFVNSPLDDNIDFHAIPSPDPERKLGRTQGGGRFAFEVRNLPDGKGGFYDPQPGDQVEYYIEVFASKDIAANRPSARSELRSKMVVTNDEAVRWALQALQEESRIRQLEKKQKTVFGSE
jgi:hypothetical protein